MAWTDSDAETARYECHGTDSPWLTEVPSIHTLLDRLLDSGMQVRIEGSLHKHGILTGVLCHSIERAFDVLHQLLHKLKTQQMEIVSIIGIPLCHGTMLLL